jgi:porin
VDAATTEIESPDSIDRNYLDTKARPEGLFRYGPISLIDPYWKQINKQLQEYGISLGFTYTAVYQAASGGPGDRQAAGYDADLFGNWRLLGSPNGQNNGYLYFNTEYRHQLFTDIAPLGLGHQIGSEWGTTNGFDLTPLVVRDLYWEQRIGGDVLVARVGKIDSTVYYNSNYWQSDSKYFMNQAFSSFPVRAFPQDGLGINLTLKPSNLFYISAGSQDAEGQRTTTGFNSFFNDFDLFSAAELGITPTIPGLGSGSYRFTGWYRDATENGKPHDGGFDLSFDQHINAHLIPFFRYGFSEGNVAKLNEMISTGIGWQGGLITRSDVLGIAMSWGQSSDSRVRDQYVAEIFYRLQVSPDNQVTFGYQAIIDPSSAPDENIVGVFEMRWRVSL